jgi:uncharacterized protein (DUF1330 family)
MAGYIIVDVRVTDPVPYEHYKAAVSATLTPFGGRFLVRGGRAETLEGDWQPNRLVVLAFDSVEQARSWWESPAYAPLKQLRQSASEASMILVEGVDEGPAGAGAAGS